MKQYRFYIVGDSCYDEGSLSLVGIDETNAESVFKGGCWHSVTVRQPYTAGMELQVESACRVYSPEAGTFVRDPTNFSCAFMNIVLIEWTFSQPATGDGWKKLPRQVANVIANKIIVDFYEQSENADFLAWLKIRQGELSQEPS